ncbi:MAG TPA: sugar phosphate isomerase/epimerase family protein [Planctomycetota bacterium]|jgi:sugar phosphate isomerase/epimerase|nr:sugar phosphate isomerase/epimerase family protein [Planctomycetota bacterium]
MTDLHPPKALPGRRAVLAGVGSMAALSLLSPRGDAKRSMASNATPLFSISLAQWSLHRTLRSGELDNLDFARVTARDYGLQAVEYVSQFFSDKATDFDYLGEMKQRAADAGVRSLLIMVDGEGSLAHEDSTQRARAIENHFPWIAAASFLGCHSIRVNAAGGGDRGEMAKRAADSLHHLASYGAPYGVNVIVENHGGPSSDGSWLAGVMRQADHPGVGTLPDFGNFSLGGGEWYDRYQGVAELMPFAKAVSAKSHDFDGEGNETHTDYRRMLKIVLDAGYRGYIGIEYEGGGLSEDDGIRHTKALLETVRGELAE